MEMSNEVTIEVIRRILGGFYGPWPGVEVPMTDAAGLAVLGTPNGRGVAWLLATHKEQFGRRTIESVRVWSDDGDPSDANLAYYLYFKIVPLGG